MKLKFILLSLEKTQSHKNDCHRKPIEVMKEERKDDKFLSFSYCFSFQ